MLYFAYGSNMDWEQMRRRCPSARFVGVAVLFDHKLSFTRRSSTRDCGVADVIPEDGKNVWGVVYEIADIDVGGLDSSEGYRPGRKKNSYYRRECMVFQDGDKRQPIMVWSYFAERQHKPPLPNAKYKNLILLGAKHWHLPEDYIQELEKIEVSK